MSDKKNNKTIKKVKLKEQVGENLSAQESIKKGMTVRSKPINKPNQNDEK